MSETLLSIIAAFKQWAINLTESLRDDRITVAQWYAGMEQIITRVHIAAMIEGLGVDEIPTNMMQVIRNNVNFQLEYLDNFKDVIESSPDFINGWVNRSTLYGGSAKVSYWEGKIVQEVGRALPLPAMPGQGSQCLSSCGCDWRIETIDAERGDYDAYWQLNPQKRPHCQTCLGRSEEWNPVRIRDGSLLL